MSNEKPMSDELEELLNHSTPATTELTETSQKELERLVVSVRALHDRRAGRRRRAVTGVAALGLVVGAGSMVAAGSASLGWVPWFGDAVRSESFVTPRGQSCEAVFKLRNEAALPSAARAELREFLASFEPTPEAIAAEAHSFAATVVTVDETGEVTTVGAMVNDDDIERMARERVIGGAVLERADSLGVLHLAEIAGVSECDE
jgi:hypothetical protein